MKKPVVDYREFRLSKINTPQFSHLKILLGWIGYFALYILTENLIPRDRCYVVHCALDDVIPFWEAFVIPYVFWYLLIAISLVYFAFYNVDSFTKFNKFIIITQVIAMFIYIVFPNRQDLRPLEFPRENVLTQIVNWLYTVDTNTNVCPSCHVCFSLGIASAWLKERTASKVWKTFILVMVILICLSTMFIKQHSALDALAAIPICLLAEYIVYGKSYWRKKI